jgi:hypothetical protein
VSPKTGTASNTQKGASEICQKMAQNWSPEFDLGSPKINFFRRFPVAVETPE